MPGASSFRGGIYIKNSLEICLRTGAIKEDKMRIFIKKGKQVFFNILFAKAMFSSPMHHVEQLIRVQNTPRNLTFLVQGCKMN